jgi:membrane-associated protease RseP (regulator of RpoE activity)
MWFEGGTRHLLTDKKGSYAVRDLSPGTVRVRVDRKGYVSVEKTIEIAVPHDADRPIEFDPIDLAEGGTAEGEVVDDRGDPIVGARIAKDAVPNYLPPGPLPAGIVASNARGEFSLDGLPEGRVVLEAYSPGLGRGKVESVEIRAGRTATRIRITVKKGQGLGGTEASGGLLISLKDARGQVEVASVSPSSQAERAGLLPGDRIVRVDGQTVSSVQDAQSKLAGPERQDVLIDIERQKKSIRLRISRERLRR